MSTARAIFLDRDGVLNEDLGYVGQPDRFRIYPWIGQALKLLADKGFLLFIVTNQSGIARGYYSEEDMHHLHGILRDRLCEDNVTIEDIFHSPDLPDTPSKTRKPSPYFVLEAARKYGLDLKTSYVIGDSSVDMELGRFAGCKTILVRTGKGAETEKITSIHFDLVFDHLLDAAFHLHSLPY